MGAVPAEGWEGGGEHGAMEISLSQNSSMRVSGGVSSCTRCGSREKKKAEHKKAKSKSWVQPHLHPRTTRSISRSHITRAGAREGLGTMRCLGSWVLASMVLAWPYRRMRAASWWRRGSRRLPGRLAQADETVSLWNCLPVTVQCTFLIVRLSYLQ